MTSRQEKQENALDAPEVIFALKYLKSSIEACAEENTPQTLQLCCSYLGAFITRMLYNQLIFDAGSIANEIQYYASKFIVDFSMLPEVCGDKDE